MKAYQHILLAMDFSEISKRAAKRAVLLAGYFNSRLTIVHVLETHGALPEPMEQDTHAVKQHQDQFERFFKEINISGAMPIIHVTSDSAKDVIVRVAEEIKADLIVIGSAGVNDARRALSATAEGVLRGARCEVLVVRSLNK